VRCRTFQAQKTRHRRGIQEREGKSARCRVVPNPSLQAVAGLFSGVVASVLPLVRLFRGPERRHCPRGGVVCAICGGETPWLACHSRWSRSRRFLSGWSCQGRAWAAVTHTVRGDEVALEVNSEDARQGPAQKSIEHQAKGLACRRRSEVRDVPAAGLRRFGTSWDLRFRVLSNVALRRGFGLRLSGINRQFVVKIQSSLTSIFVFSDVKMSRKSPPRRARSPHAKEEKQEARNEKRRQRRGPTGDDADTRCGHKTRRGE